jgi:hypothetical protein
MLISMANMVLRIIYICLLRDNGESHAYAPLYYFVRNNVMYDLTLYLSFSRPSKSTLFAQLRAIQIAAHMTEGIAATHNVSLLLWRTNPPKKTTPAKIPFNTGI